MYLWLVTGTLFGVGYLGARFLLGYPRAPGMRTLAPREVAFLEAAADAMYPPGGDLGLAGRDAGIAAYLDDYLGRLPARQRRLIRALLASMEHATLVFSAPPPRGRRRFSALSPAQRSAVLDGWRTSRWPQRRFVFASLRAVVSMAYASHPALLAELGLRPWAIETPALETDSLYRRTAAPVPGRPTGLRPPRAAVPLDPLAPGDRAPVVGGR